jgi:hypothetical protein
MAGSATVRPGMRPVNNGQIDQRAVAQRIFFDEYF